MTTHPNQLFYLVVSNKKSQILSINPEEKSDARRLGERNQETNHSHFDNHYRATRRLLLSRRTRNQSSIRGERFDGNLLLLLRVSDPRNERLVTTINVCSPISRNRTALGSEFWTRRSCAELHLCHCTATRIRYRGSESDHYPGIHNAKVLAVRH